MFEELQKRRAAGRSPRESARLWVLLGAALVVGTVVFFGGELGPNSSAPLSSPRAAPADGGTTSRPLDTKPLERLRTSPAAPEAFDVPALSHLATEIRSGAVRRAPDRVLDVAAVVALDPATAVGTLVETVGTVSGLDAEVFASPSLPAANQVVAFALDGEPAAPGAPPPRILVVQVSSTDDPAGGRPVDASRAEGAREPLTDGMRVRVRGYWLQKRVGSVGGVTGISVPTPVLVLREARITYPELPGIPSPEQASFEVMRDRTLNETKTTNDAPVYEILVWARKRGAKRLAEDLRSGALPSTFWGSKQLRAWGKEIGDDQDKSLPDPRTLTLASRGKVIETTGIFVQQDREDWEHVPRNLYGVDDRWKYWITSDFYGNATFLLDCPFAVSEFPGIREPGRGPPQRVKVFGVFIKPYSFEPAGSHLRRDKRADDKFATLPYFVLLHMAPDEDTYQARPLHQNPFFWVGVSLLVFVSAFFLVMSRLERKEYAALEAQRRKINRKLRGAPALADGPDTRGESAAGGGTGGGGGGGASPSVAPSDPPG